MHDLLEEVEDTGWGGVAVGEVLAGVEGELADGEFHDGEAETPHVGLDGVLLALDALGRHVRGCADEGVGDGVDELARDAEIAQLDEAARVDEDVGRLDVAVHDVVLDVEVGQSAEGGLGDLAEHVDADGAEVAGDAVEGAGGVSWGREGG